MKHEIVLTRGDLTLRPLAPDDGPALRELVDAAMWAGNSAPLPVDGAASLKAAVIPVVLHYSTADPLA